MLFRFNLNSKFLFSKISDSLKVLQLKQPVTQKQIKNKYRELAKKYHPDSLDQKTSSKQIQEKFVKITVAYNQLKDLDENVLNEEQYDIRMPQADREKIKSQDQINRQKTYDYLNRKTVDPNYKPSTNPNIIPKVKKPLYKTVPELFVGLALVVVLMGQFFHKTVIQTKSNKQKEVKQYQTKAYQNVFRNFNYKKSFTTSQIIEPQKNYDRN